VCRAGACVALASGDCTVAARPEDVTDDRTMWIGAMFAKDGPMAHDFDGAMRDVELGRRDFVEVTSGLPGPRPGDPPRPIGLVECNDATDPARAARHLVLDLRLPAVIGFSRSKEVADLAAMLFNPQRVVAFASNTAAMLSAIPAPPGEPRMVWRTTLSSSMRIHVLTALVRDVLEPELRARKEVGRDEPIRVAFLNVDNTTGVSNTDAVVTSLRFNGKSVADNGEDFVQLLVSDGKDRQAEAERILPALARFAPHVVLDGGTGAAIIPLLETALAGKVRPRYALGSVDVDPITGARDPLLARRVFDVDTTSSTTASAKFDLRYAAVFDPTTSPTQVVTGGPYDAFYALAYALVALGDAPATGPAIARALARLAGPGPSIDVGPGGIYAATAALQRGGAIDLEGTTTFLDFDETTGDPTVDFAIYCVKAGRDGVLRPDSGLVWDRKLRKVTGSARCL
jgi:ABC-type branched-subunit amino acid transport system substrate-binding protein